MSYFSPSPSPPSPSKPSPSPYGYEPSAEEQVKEWLQENLRVICSIFIVAAIAIGIHSYSQEVESDVPKVDEHPCEKYGDSFSIDGVPIKCRAYWNEKIN